MVFARLFPVLAFCLALVPLPLCAGQVTVFAASSLKTALDQIAPGFEAATGHDLAASLAGSSVLARQIEYGAPADVFISANPDWMDVLDGQGLILPETRVDLLGNRLVVIAPAGRAADLPDLSVMTDSNIAMALVDAVPAGIYGKAALISLGLWPVFKDHVVQTDNVRAALALVALDEVPLGIVYATDAKAEPRVEVVQEIPETAHPPIRYPAARLTDTKAARAFIDYLQGPEAAQVFQDQGFTILHEPKR
ncbi:molybdate ABC transporter substrate-binding protein [Primorskyibacter sp. 2E233]|uniref:molybdate ABC transporter substrate-binding protein n=1 Tax=Primorskyibacter sp. 2E233 TaxID=3413431 RepID=UPI003BEF73FA